MKYTKHIICLMLALLCLTLCACGKEPEGPEDQIIYYNIDSEPVTLDPQIANDSASRLIIMNTFEGLVRTGENNSILKGAAESWDISGDKMMYTFHLRNGLKWNDGTPLKANDFVYGITRTIQAQTSSPTAQTLYCIKNAEKVNTGKAENDTLGVFATDDRTVVFQLEYPDADFLQLLSTPPAMPCNREFFEKTSGQYGRDSDKLLCNGAFYIRENGWSHDEYIYLRKNKEYVGQEKPVPAGVNINIGKTETDVCTAIEKGDIDCGAITTADLDRAEKLKMHLTGFGDTIWGISFNTKDEILKSRDIRCGLLSSLDRKKILSDLPDHCTPTENIIPESAVIDGKSYRSKAGKLTFSSKDKPEVLLAKGMKEVNTDIVTNITILCTDDESTQVFVNNIIEKWNGLTGGYFNKKPVPLSELKDTVSGENYQIIIAPLTIQGNTPLSTLELFESTSQYNTASLSSEAYDNFVSKIRKNLTSESAETVKEAERYLLDEGIFYPLYVENRYYASAENVTGIIFHPYGAEVDFFYAVKTSS